MTVQRHHQEIPAGPAAVLRSLLAAARDVPAGGRRGISPDKAAAWRRLAGYVGQFVAAEWTMQAVAETLAVSRQAVAHIVGTYPAGPEDVEGLPAVPAAPQKPVRPSPWAPALPDEIREELQQLRSESRHISGPVRGTAREAAPEWLASRKFAARVYELTTDGPYTVYSVARDLGVRVNAIKNRLGRHDFQSVAEPAGSQ